MNLEKKRIEELERALEMKDVELKKLYTIVNSLNSCLGGIIQETEAGIRAATSLYRKISSKKLPKVKGLTFSSKYMISKENLNSYFDIFELPKQRGAGILVCDAKGYGTSAVVMSIASSLIEAEESQCCDAFFEGLNKEISNCASFPKDGSEASIKILYVLIDKASLQMELCSVGMPGLLVVRDDQLFCLGESTHATLETPKRDSFRLNPGDRILIPNNGILLSESESGSKFGMDGIKKALVNAQHLPISDIISNISFELDTFTDAKRSRLKGDVSILGIELERKMFYVV